MTVDSPMITLGPQVAKRQMQPTTSNMFHDYASRQHSMRDHTLLVDLSPQDLGNTQSLLYEEQEHTDSQKALLSPCASIADSTCSQFEAFDLKPQFEQSDDLLKFGLGLKEFGSLEPELTETSNLLWSSLNCVDNLKMEDMFQMDKGDAIDQGPTLNELNAVDSVPLVGDDTMDHLLSSVDPTILGQVLTNSVQQTPTPVFSSASVVNNQSQSLFTSSGGATPAVTASLVAPSVGGALPTVNNVGLASKLPLLVGTPQTVPLSPVALASTAPVVAPGVFACQKLATTQQVAGLGLSAPVQRVSVPTPSSWTVGMGAPLGPRGVKRSASPSSESTGSVERKWEEIKEFIHNDEALAAKKIKREPDVAYTPTDDLESQEEDNASEAENSEEEDGEEDHKPELSDNESIGSHSSFLEEFMTGRKDKRYFWQYNTQAKGPKGKRLCKTVKTDDPHILCTFEDPVFDPELNQNRYKHNGKARRGDGNDVTPNAWKLYQIGSELKMLGRELNDLVPVSEMPVGVRSKTRKEKNKFASRACRLKKKAQHEAHKLKLYGLEQEHNQLMRVLQSIRFELKTRIQQPQLSDKEHLSVKLDKLIKKHLTVMIAGHTTEYVNSVLEKIAAGDTTGGIPIPPRPSRTRSVSE